MKTARQTSVSLIAAEMVVMQIDIDSATSIVTRRNQRVADYVADLYDNKAIKTGDQFRRDVIKTAAPGMRM